MAKAYYQDGEKRAVEYTPSGAAIAANDIIVLGATDTKKCRVGVAFKDVADGVTSDGAVDIRGVFRFPKVSGAVIAAGDSVNWDASAGEVDDNAATAASGDVIEFGTAVEAKGNGDTTIDILIDEPGTYNA